MQISWDTFLRCVREIKALSDSLQDGWTLQESPREYATYATKKRYVTTVNAEEPSPLVIEYHVVYNVSYGAPMLCLNAWRTDGSLLTMEQCWSCMDFSDAEDVYSTLTQMDHPVLMRPFLTLHPCRTAHIIGEMFAASKNPVVSWLSAVGPVVKLDLGLRYAKLAEGK